MVEHFHRYIGVTEEEESVLRRALEVHRDLLRNGAAAPYGSKAHRQLKAQRYAAIQALIKRAFPEVID